MFICRNYTKCIILNLDEIGYDIFSTSHNEHVYRRLLGIERSSVCTGRIHKNGKQSNYARFLVYHVCFHFLKSRCAHDETTS